MAVYTIANLIEPQYVANGAAAALTFSTQGGPSAVPANYQYHVQTLWASNNSNAPVTLIVYWVPSGGSVGATTLICSVTVPVSSSTFPAFPIQMLWGQVLKAGDAIEAIAGSGSALLIYGSGGVIVP